MQKQRVNDQRSVKKIPLPTLPLKRVSPLGPGWTGAITVLSLVTLCNGLVQGYYYLGSRSVADYLIGTSLFLTVILGITGIIAGLLHWAKQMPSRYVWFMLASFCVLSISFFGPIPLTLLVVLVMIICFSLLGAVLYRYKDGAYRETKSWKRRTAGAVAAAALILICMLGYWLMSEGKAELTVPYPLQTVKSAEQYRTTLSNPAEPGKFRVKSITYQSDPTSRKDLGEQGMLITEPVDGSAFVEQWAARRTKTFGFGPEAMPLNGTVWYPEGDGPFPLVLIVHGNHLATEPSDPGYAYLGELLASRGFILASIDQNYLNSSPFNDLFMFSVLKGENRARGWLMLEHLKTWDKWNSTEGNPFYGKVNMQRIGLIGHSRGGEAVTTAAAYNEMTSYPEDANIKFDYHFNIRSIVSIAGTDGQYQPAGQPIALKDVNYLALHGSHDMDVSSFAGGNQYHRTQFTDNNGFFKSYVYIYGANHGQFNTEWGKHDGVGLGNMLFNTAELLPQEQQTLAAKVLISSFLEATLKGQAAYQTVFQDLGHAREWLPETMYISNYWDANTTTISSYDEDSDPETTTLSGGRLEGESLGVWKEQKMEMAHTVEQYSAVSLEWDHAAASSVPAYRVILPDRGIETTEQSSIVFSLANGNADHDAEDGTNALVDLTVLVEDDQGNASRLPLSSVSPLLPMFEGSLAKRPFAFFQTTKEPIFQNYAFSLAEFAKTNSDFNPERIRKISFVFDQTAKGNLFIRDIGIRNAKP